MVFITVVSFLIFHPCLESAGEPNPHRSDDWSDRRQAVLDEIEAGAPAWAGIYSVTSIDSVTEYCLAPRSGIVVALHHANHIKVVNAGEIVSFNECRLKLAWEDPEFESDDMCLVPFEGTLSLIRTGDIHRFYLRVRNDQKQIDRYPNRSLEPKMAKQIPQLSPKLSFFESAQPLYCEVMEVESTKTTKRMRRSGQGQSRNRFYLEQRLALDIGSDHGAFEGLVLYPAIVGSVLPIQIIDIDDTRSIGEISISTSRRGNALRKGDLLTTGEVGFR